MLLCYRSSTNLAKLFQLSAMDSQRFVGVKGIDGKNIFAGKKATAFCPAEEEKFGTLEVRLLASIVGHSLIVT